MIDLLRWGVLILFIALMVMAATADVLWRRIPNWAVVGVMLTAGAAWLIESAVTSWSSGLAAGVVTLLATYGLYHVGMVGAGDVKLFVAAALFVGLGHVLQMAAFTALAGGVLAIGVLVLHPRRVMRGLTARGRAENPTRGIPYGLAIAIGALATTFGMRGFLPYAAA